jgi:hypothetical protein
MVFGRLSNNSGVGKISCGEQGLVDVDYRILQDHNTNPGDARNGTTIGMGLPQLLDDPDCDAEFVFPNDRPRTRKPARSCITQRR